MSNKYLLRKRYYRASDRHSYDLWLCQCSHLFRRRSSNKSPISCQVCQESLGGDKFDAYIALKALYNKYQGSAWDRELSFNLHLFEFMELVLSNCYYCGSDFSNKFTNSYGILLYNGIDRQDNDVGYQSSNCVSCCKTCNLAKRDLSVDEFVSWAKKIVKNSKNIDVIRN